MSQTQGIAGKCSFLGGRGGLFSADLMLQTTDNARPLLIDFSL